MQDARGQRSRLAVVFGPVETVLADPHARLPDAAFAPGGPPTIVWTTVPGGSVGLPIARIRAYGQASTRVG